uniref:RNA-directed RNA polymerase n=1 Tax=Barns Ness breadcrumb sponge aquatic picorna-like virus 1 TaxID=2021877 RepID=A0A221LFI8_9VIRU|nr:hypothetical protein [Barns Ness breadcrumb sponge aquatic picorna-like virus 1]
MKFLIQASTHGNCVQEKQVCQRLAPHTRDPLVEFLMILCRIVCWKPLGWHCCFDVQMGEFSEKRAAQMKWVKNNHARILEREKRNFCDKQKVKKELRKKEPNVENNYDAQIGSASIATAFANLANIKGVHIDDATLNKVENLGALFLACKDCTTVSGFLSTCFLYLKTHYSRSVANLAAQFLSEVLGANFDAQAGEFGIESEDKPTWLLLLKDLQSNWSLVVHNDGFKKISHILSLALALGLCESSSLDFKLAGMKMFSIGAVAKHATAVDLIDAVFETITFFAEGGYACFERRSIKPLLYGNMENEEFEELYSKCLRCQQYARSGNLDKFEGMTENDYEALLARCIEKANILYKTCRGVVEKNLILRKLDSLRLSQATFRQTRVQGGLREAPYSIGIFGGTSVGKSTVANVMMITTLMHNGYDASDEFVTTLNEQDKFWSNFRSYTNGVLIDDIGNTKADFVERAPTSLMIQLVNNVRVYANMAEVEMKGKVSVEPKVVICTKNVKDTCASTYSNEPASITRRDRITLTVKVKPEYAVHDMLNERKVMEAFPDGAPLIPDFWDITVEKSFPIPNQVKGKAASVGWEVIRWNGKDLQNIGIPELIRWVGQDSRKFYASQKQLVANSNNLANKIEICSVCEHAKPYVCNCDDELPVYTVPYDDRCVVGHCKRCGNHHTAEAISQTDPLSYTKNVFEDMDSEEESDDEDEYLEAIESQFYVESDDEDEFLEAMDNQIGEKLVGALLPRYRKWDMKLRPKFDYWTNHIEERTVKTLLKRLDWLETSRWVVWTNYIPAEWLEKEWMKHIVWFTNEKELRTRIRCAYLNHFIFMVIISLQAWRIHSYFIAFLAFPLSGIAGIVKCEKERLYQEVSKDNKDMPELFRLYRDRHIKWITGCCTVVACCYAVAQIWKAFKVIPSKQGNLNPTSNIEIVERDSEVNPWAGVVVSEMPCSRKAKTTTPDQLEKLVNANLCHMSIQVDGLDKNCTFWCNAFFPKSNVAIIPQHAWMANDIKANFIRHDPSNIGGNFECFLYRKNSIDIPNTDLSLIWVPNGGDWKDLTEYLPLTRFASVPGRLTYKKSDGSIIGSKLFMQPDDIVTKAADFYGAKYDLKFNTFSGLCMATIITETKGPLIGGFHLGGREGTVHGCSGLLLKSEFDDAFERLRILSGVVLAKSSGEIPKELYSVQFYDNADIHYKSPINFLPGGTNCKFYGQVKGRATYHSDVEETIISSHVEEVCGVPQKWGGPSFRKGWPWQASLQYSAKPSCGIEGSLLELACKDYIGPIIKRLDRLTSLKELVKPLNRMETVCGIDGVRFIDKMPPNTSIGFPLSGPKSNFIEPLDPKDYPSHQCPAQLDEIFWKHAEDMEELYLKGERAYPIFKACLKDEPTKLTKEKVRVFQGAPVALQLLVRKYYLPIARALSMMPITSECAVGVNAQGPEWDQLATHVKKFGEDRILAGDYSKYDLRMPAQLMFSSFRILMDIGEHCGYSKRDLAIMEGIATDICYPLMAYNGDLIQLLGSNPSGQNLTVYINDLGNSLLLRCAYFSIYKDRENIPKFQDVCALITYGDDAKSSVKEGFDEYNHIAVAQFLEQHDMKFTMPDKESEPTPYMTDVEADFLKRKNVYCEDTGLIMGALDEDSIFKSLHATLKSKALTKEQQSMQNIDGALREWFAHGRDVYELRREQMQEVARRADIAHGCTIIHETYDDRLAVWRKRYAPEETE